MERNEDQHILKSHIYDHCTSITTIAIDILGYFFPGKQVEHYGSDCHISGKLQVSGAQCLRPSRQGMPSRQGKKRAEKQTLLPLEVYSRCIRDTA